MNYRFVEKLEKELVVLDGGRVGLQMWSRVRTRKDAVCVVARVKIEKFAWRPVGNAQNRSHRISDGAMSRLMKGGSQ